ncbi:MAG: uroporphyrinogen-III synthase [Cytophagales bacterium]|nr:uroporphyrinogen-III synthase [Cytophagales bacterium]MDW8384385.1 uroporphyrinogen-III synthase [Flammeovirgaceae bacterium]
MESKELVTMPKLSRPVKTILITQADPGTPNNPYQELAKKYQLQIDFRPFIEIQPLSAKEFRKQKVNILEHTAIIFTSRNAIDHFFTIAKELRVEIPTDMKYFCISEQTSNYLQKYIAIRKRKIFTGKKTAQDLIEIMKKHKDEKFLYPCSSIRRGDIPEFLEKNNYQYTEAVIYDTVASDLSNLDYKRYDMLAFFSPSGVNALLKNFPDYQQGDQLFVAFGATTAQAIRDHNLRVDVEAPMPNVQSMAGAIEWYVKQCQMQSTM